MTHRFNPKMLVATSMAALVAIGGAGFAVAQDATSAPAQAAGQGMRQGRGLADDTRLAALAAKLGVTAEQLQQAFEQIRPAEGQRAKGQHNHDEMAQKLADALGKNVEEVKVALDSQRDSHHGNRRDALVQRLDQAVADGKISASDKESILKAFDAGVLGGRGMGDMGEMGGKPGHMPGHMDGHMRGNAGANDALAG